MDNRTNTPKINLLLEYPALGNKVDKASILRQDCCKEQGSVFAVFLGMIRYLNK